MFLKWCVHVNDFITLPLYCLLFNVLVMCVHRVVFMRLCSRGCVREVVFTRLCS